MHSQQLTARLLYPLGKFQSFVLTTKHSYFAENGNLDSIWQGRNQFFNEFWFFKQKRTIMSLSCNSLRTAQIDINCINFILNHFCCLHHYLRVISTKLCDQGTVFRASCEMLLLVIFSSNHHFGVEHRGISQRGPVTTREQSEWQFGLLDHGRAH